MVVNHGLGIGTERPYESPAHDPPTLFADPINDPIRDSTIVIRSDP